MIIHPANCYKNDPVWFLYKDISSRGEIKKGEKAIFVAWADDYASAIVKLSTGEVCCTDSNILEIREE